MEKKSFTKKGWLIFWLIIVPIAILIFSTLTFLMGFTIEHIGPIGKIILTYLMLIGAGISFGLGITRTKNKREYFKRLLSKNSISDFLFGEDQKIKGNLLKRCWLGLEKHLNVWSELIFWQTFLGLSGFLGSYYFLISLRILILRLSIFGIVILFYLIFEILSEPSESDPHQNLNNLS